MLPIDWRHYFFAVGLRVASNSCLISCSRLDRHSHSLGSLSLHATLHKLITTYAAEANSCFTQLPTYSLRRVANVFRLQDEKLMLLTMAVVCLVLHRWSNCALSRAFVGKLLRCRKVTKEISTGHESRFT